jgi:hypothetical protein
MAMNRLAKFPIAKFYQGRNVYYSKEDVEKQLLKQTTLKEI